MKDMSDKELIAEVESFHQLCGIVAQGVKDKMIADAAEEELVNRGYDVQTNLSVYITKIDEDEEEED